MLSSSTPKDLLHILYQELGTKDIRNICILNKDLYKKTESNEFWVNFCPEFLKLSNNPDVHMNQPGSARNFVLLQTIDGVEDEILWKMEVAVAKWRKRYPQLRKEINFVYLSQPEAKLVNLSICSNKSKNSSIKGDTYYFRNKIFPTCKYNNEVRKNLWKYSLSFFDVDNCGYPFYLGSNLQTQMIKEKVKNFSLSLQKIHEAAGCDNQIKCKKDQMCAIFIENAKKFIAEEFKAKLSPENPELVTQFQKINVDNFDHFCLTLLVNSFPDELQVAYEKFKKFYIHLDGGDNTKIDSFFNSLI